MDTSLEILIQQDLDGVNSPEERDRLKEMSRANPAIQQQLEEYQGLAQLVSDLPMVEPPATFTARVMQQLPASTSAGGGSLWDAIFAPRLRMAYALAAGLILGIAGTLSVLPGAPVPAGVEGTIIRATSIGVGPAVVEIQGREVAISAPEVLDFTVAIPHEAAADAISWDAPSVPGIAYADGRLTLSRFGPGTLTFRMAGSGPVDLVIEIPGDIPVTGRIPVR